MVSCGLRRRQMNMTVMKPSKLTTVNMIKTWQLISARSSKTGKRGTTRARREHEHFIVHNAFFTFAARLVRNCDIEIAVVTRVGGTGKVAFHFITFVDSHGVGGVEYGLPRICKSGTTQKERARDTDFQWVYWAWGPVENLTFLWVHSKEMSNQAKKAWISNQGHS